MAKNPNLAKVRIIIQLEIISTELNILACQIKQLDSESDLYKHLIATKIFPARRYFDKVLNEVSALEIAELV